MIRQMIMRRVNRLVCANTLNQYVSRSTLIRCFSSYRNSNENNDYMNEGEDDYGSSNFAGEQNQRYDQRDKPVRIRHSFNAEMFEKFQKLSSSEVIHHLDRLANGQENFENIAYNFSNGLQNLEGTNAWKNMDSDARKNFVNNLLALYNEAQTRRMKFNIAPSIRYIFFQSFVASDPTVFEHVFKYLKDMNLPQSLTRQIVNNLYVETLKAVTSNRRLKDMNNVFKEAEQMLADLILRGHKESHPAVIRRHYQGLAYYLTLCACDSIPFNRKNTNTMFQALLNYELTQPSPRDVLLGWMALAALSQNKRMSGTIESSGIVTDCNEYIKDLNPQKHKTELGFDSDSPRMPKEAHDKNKPKEEIPLIEPSKYLTTRQFCAVAQSILVRAEEMPRPILPLYNMILLAAPRLNFNTIKFKKWVCTTATSNDIETASNDVLYEIALIVTECVSAARFHNVFIKLLRVIEPKLANFKGVRGWCVVYLCTGRLLSATKEHQTGDQLQPIKNMTEEDRLWATELNQKALEHIKTNEYITYPSIMAKVFQQLVFIDKKMTKEELRATNMHQQFWESINNRPNLFNMSRTVFDALEVYDPIHDAEAQQLLLGLLDKMIITSGGREDGKPERRRKPKGLKKFLVKFEENKDSLSPLGTQVLAKLQEWSAYDAEDAE